MNFQSTTVFNFEYVTTEETVKIIKSLNKKKSTSGFIPTWILHQSVNTLAQSLTECINYSLSAGVFPDELKLADVIPIFKKGDPMDKKNYRPISILPALSKVFERLMYNRLSEYFEPILSKLLCGFRSKYSTQHALLNLLHSGQNCLDKSGIVGTILMDLSKAFDSLPHDLIIAKLEAYGLSKKSLELVYSYLNQRTQRTRVGSCLSSWLEILLGVPQGSILGPLLFNIFINDLLFVITETEICKFADDNTIYSCASSVGTVMRRLNSDISSVMDWFKVNHLVANPDKFQMMILGLKNTDLTSIINIHLNGIIINPKDSVKLLGITLDKALTFQEHINNICVTANRNLRCLIRIRIFLSVDQAKLLYNAYIKSIFGYCPLVWMFCYRNSYLKMKKSSKKIL